MTLARIDALQRDAQAVYEGRVEQAKAARRAEWPDKRREIMRRRFEIEQAARAAGEDAFWPTPEPSLDCPDWFLADVRVEPVTVNTALPNPTVVPGHDALGRPLRRALSPEQAFKAAEAKPEGRAAHALRRLVEAQS